MPFIIETIVTTRDTHGRINFAPMGVEWGASVIVLKPYQDTTTFRNLVATREAVVNVTDNVMLFAQAAIADPTFPHRPARVVQGAVLEDVCSWREVRVLKVDTRAPRARIPCQIVYRGVAREFIGYNRAQAAVIEAAILATRIRFLPMEQILRDIERLQVIVRKTGGAREHTAMQLLVAYIQRAAAVHGVSRQGTS